MNTSELNKISNNDVSENDKRIKALSSCHKQNNKRYGIEFNFSPKNMLFHIHFYYCIVENDYTSFYDTSNKIIFKISFPYFPAYLK